MMAEDRAAIVAWKLFGGNASIDGLGFALSVLHSECS